MFNMITVYHSTNIGVHFEEIQLGKDGGIHFGSYAQAKARNMGNIYEAQIDPKKVRRCKDPGHGWEKKIKDAKNRGFDAIIYLNRYEGLDRDTIIQRVQEGWTMDKCEPLSDKKFKKLFPEARDSYIVFEGPDILQVEQNSYLI